MRRLLTVAALGWAGLSAEGATLQMTIAPTSVAWNAETFVQITITNIPLGSAVQLDLHVDADRNGVLGAPDFLVGRIDLKDGVTSRWGAATFPGDDDGFTNFSIRTRIPYFDPESPHQVAGS
jgi:hypothetical protein